jgi:hypothetical protein
MKIVEMMDRLQKALDLEDVQYASYLQTEATTLSKVRAGVKDLPLHSSCVVLDTLGFVMAAQTVLAVLPRKTKEKAIKAIQERAFNMAQQALINDLKKQLHGVTLDY